jgi:hypothetical protein
MADASGVPILNKDDAVFYVPVVKFCHQENLIDTLGRPTNKIDCVIIDMVSCST